MVRNERLTAYERGSLTFDVADTGEYVTGPYEFVELAGASHWIPNERPDELATAIVRRASPA